MFLLRRYAFELLRQPALIASTVLIMIDAATRGGILRLMLAYAQRHVSRISYLSAFIFEYRHKRSSDSARMFPRPHCRQFDMVAIFFATRYVDAADRSYYMSRLDIRRRRLHDLCTRKR